MNNKQNDIDELITRSLVVETTIEEEGKLRAWIELSKENNAHYQKLKRAFELSDGYYKQTKTEPALDIDKEWNHFLKQIDSGKADKVRSLNPLNAYSLLLRVAAALALVVGSWFVINYFISANKITLIETADATREVTLPDGTQITLNKNSKLSYTVDFGKDTRNVTLQGEAFFEVVRDPKKPFIITANEATVQVLGTSFNVKAYDSEEQLQVVVATGTVKISVPNINQEIILQAGDRGVFARGQKQLSQLTNTDINFLAWKTHRLVFTETDLRTVIEAVNHAYQTNITMPANIPSTCVVTVTFDQQSLESILNVLKTTLGLVYQNKNGTIQIIHAGC